MIDIRLIRESGDLVRENIRKKGQDEKVELVDRVLELDLKWRKEKKRVDDLRAERNRISESINVLMKGGKKGEAKKLIVEAKAIPGKIAKIDVRAGKLAGEIKEIMLRIPNMMDASVPEGRGEEDNVELRKWGKIPKFGFDVKGHVELVENLGVADFDASAKVAGNGFYYLKGDLAL